MLSVVVVWSLHIVDELEGLVELVFHQILLDLGIR